ncbi:MAG: sporulation protein YabP [Clostridia bacterium]|nr:sporulation protein YabP [Clostridia bacterium]
MTENKIKMPHSLILKDRSQLTLSGVTDVDSFDENIITAYTDYGELTVKGEGLHISILNIDTGELSIDGTVASLSYLENQPRSTSFFSKVFR